MALALFVDRATALTRTGLRRCRQEPATDAARVLACLGPAAASKAPPAGGRTSRRLQSTTGGRTSRRPRQILRQWAVCSHEGYGPAAHPGSPWRQLPFCRLIHQNACSDRAVAPRTAENAPGGKTPKQTLTGELISISYKMEKFEDPGSEWISICFELSSGNSNQNAENPGPRNVSICFEYRAETQVKTPKIQDPGTSRNVSGFRPFFVSLLK